MNDMLAPRSRQPAPGSPRRCRCPICILPYSATEGAYREIIVYGLDVEFVKKLQMESKAAMLD